DCMEHRTITTISVPQRLALVVMICVLIWFGWQWNRRHDRSVPVPESTAASPTVAASRPSVASANLRLRPREFAGTESPEAKVATKLSQFARSRYELAQALARRHNVVVPREVEDFFAALQSGNWDEIERRFEAINGGDSSAGHASKRSPEV